MTILTHTFENSSMLSNAAYDTETKELSVAFVNGKTYTYFDVEKDIWNELIISKSAGRYFNSVKANLVQKK